MLRRTGLKRGNSQIKKSPLRRMGPVGKANIRSSRIVSKMAAEMGICTCEIRLNGCTRRRFLTTAHRHDRRWYDGIVELLSHIDQWVIGCTSCHERIEHDKELTKKVFKRLRGRENEDKITAIRKDSQERGRQEVLDKSKQL